MKPSIRVISLVLVCLLSLGLSPTICGAAYQITEQELSQLDSNLNQLATLNSQLSADLIKSKQELVIVRTELVKYQQDLLQTQKELVQLSRESQLTKQDLLQAQTSLSLANQSLTKYESEVNSKIKKLTLERDLSILGIVAMAFIKR